MPPAKHLTRYRQIAAVLVDEGFSSFLDLVGLRGFAPFASRLRAGRARHETVPVRLRHTLERLGPTFVKLGQVASTRPDIVPEEMVVELRKLQDSVPPFPWDEARATIEEELGPVESVFASFDPEPIASASLGQVYAAALDDGSPVAVKVQRPDVRKLVDIDLDILVTQARFASSHWQTAGRYSLYEVAEEFAAAVRRELDYHAEARNAAVLRGMFAGDDTVAFPKVYWSLSSERVLTLERFTGIPMNRPDLLDEAHMDRRQLAKRGVFAYLKMIFDFQFFHADPHPGNLFALPDGRAAFTDFGRVGTISRMGREELANMFIAFVDDDPALAADTLIASTGYSGATDLVQMERGLSHLITKYRERTLAQVRLGEVVRELFSMAQDYGLVLSSEFAVLMATMAMLEGLGLMIDPDFDFFDATAPFASRIAAEKWQPDHVVEAAARSARSLVRLAGELPEELHRLVHRAGEGEFRAAIRVDDFRSLLNRFEEATHRLSFALVVAASVVGLSWILSREPVPALFMWGARILWIAMMFVGLWFFASVVLTYFRRRK